MKKKKNAKARKRELSAKMKALRNKRTLKDINKIERLKESSFEQNIQNFELNGIDFQKFENDSSVFNNETLDTLDVKSTWTYQVPKETIAKKEPLPKNTGLTFFESSSDKNSPIKNFLNVKSIKIFEVETQMQKKINNDNVINQNKIITKQTKPIMLKKRPKLMSEKTPSSSENTNKSCSNSPKSISQNTQKIIQHPIESLELDKKSNFALSVANEDYRAKGQFIHLEDILKITQQPIKSPEINKSEISCSENSICTSPKKIINEAEIKLPTLTNLKYKTNLFNEEMLKKEEFESLKKKEENIALYKKLFPGYYTNLLCNFSPNQITFLKLQLLRLIIEGKDLDVTCNCYRIGATSLKNLLKGNHDLKNAHKRFLTPRENVDFGNLGEAHFLKQYPELKVISGRAIAKHPYFNFIIAANDFIVTDKNGENFLVEVKTTQSITNFDRINRDEYSQLLTTMDCFGLKKAIFYRVLLEPSIKKNNKQKYRVVRELFFTVTRETILLTLTLLYDKIITNYIKYLETFFSFNGFKLLDSDKEFFKVQLKKKITNTQKKYTLRSKSSIISREILLNTKVRCNYLYQFMFFRNNMTTRNALKFTEKKIIPRGEFLKNHINKLKNAAKNKITCNNKNVVRIKNSITLSYTNEDDIFSLYLKQIKMIKDDCTSENVAKNLIKFKICLNFLNDHIFQENIKFISKKKYNIKEKNHKHENAGLHNRKDRTFLKQIDFKYSHFPDKYYKKFCEIVKKTDYKDEFISWNQMTNNMTSQ